MKRTLKQHRHLKPGSLCFLAGAMAIMAFIWIFSSRPGTVSQDQSDLLLQLLHLPSTPLTSFIVRKSAHFSIYLLLGICWYLFLVSAGLPQSRACLFALLLAASWAAMDEFHQTFVMGRSGEMRDVILDSAGALCGIGICRLFQNLRTAPSKAQK